MLDVLLHTVLPAVTLGLLVGGVFIRLVRVNLLQTMRADYVEAARARGVPEGRVIRKHAFRNAMIPVITVMGLQIASLLAGAVLTEQIFGIPGFGKLLVDAVFNRDYAVVQGIVLCIAVGFITLTLIADILYILVNPRLRYA